MKYAVTYSVNASQTIEVEADSKEQAKELADKNVFASVCNYCSSQGLYIDGVNEIVAVDEID